ncbi:hypothetical protein FQY83_11670 [Luteimonas marina]|uniref:Uncharacterized protein n=1 Tax=Luteimonas marina TaxID=488485 RepID=A0A5C5U4J9_9GAMM|nr:hypothetical protein [Luteimonas marina]TWT20375.1 hypothetical protein FQY83_11670 [Luteimonas marina]
MAERMLVSAAMPSFQRKLEALYNSAKRWSSILLQGNHRASDRLRRPGSFLLISVKRNEPKKNAFPDKANLQTGSVTGFFDTASLPWRKTPHIHVRRPPGLQTLQAPMVWKPEGCRR